MNIFGDPVIQSLKSAKTRKSGLVPMSGQEELADSFLAFPARLETWQKAFHSYSFIKRQFHQTVTMETMTVRKISTSVLVMYFQVL